MHNPLPFQVKTNQETLTHQISLEDTRLHKYLLEKMIWLRGCSDHPFLYQKELSSALVEAEQLLGNWGRRETLEHPLWSTTNKRVRRKNCIYSKAHRNSCLWWTKPQHNTQTKNSQNLSEKEGFRNLHYNKRTNCMDRWKTFISQTEDLNFSIFHVCCYCSANRNLMWPCDLPAR